MVPEPDDSIVIERRRPEGMGEKCDVEKAGLHTGRTIRTYEGTPARTTRPAPLPVVLAPMTTPYSGGRESRPDRPWERGGFDDTPSSTVVGPAVLYGRTARRLTAPVLFSSLTERPRRKELPAKFQGWLRPGH